MISVSWLPMEPLIEDDPNHGPWLLTSLPCFSPGYLLILVCPCIPEFAFKSSLCPGF